MGPFRYESQSVQGPGDVLLHRAGTEQPELARPLQYGEKGPEGPFSQQL